MAGSRSRESSDYLSPAGSFQASFEIKPSDDADIPEGRRPRVIYVPTAGNVHYTMENGDERTRYLAAGYHPLRIKRLHATNTTVDGIEGHY